MTNQKDGITIPAGPEALTEEWLTSALRAGSTLEKAAVASFQVEPLADNFGFYGQLARVHLQYDEEEAGAPRSLIAKFSSASTAMRTRDGTKAAYAREVHFYKELAQPTDLPTPVCYYGDIDLETGWHILLLEDLAPARTGSRIEGCTNEQAELAVRRIAPFHANWWENPQVEEFAWLAEPPLPDVDTMREVFAGWWSQFCQKAEHRLSDPIQDIGERLGRQPDPATVRRYVFGAPPRTLIHRDYKLDNLFFGAPEDGIPFAVIDWQLIGRGRGVFDVAYFLSENLQIAQRRAVEMNLLQTYHQILLERGVRGYSFEQCLLDYRFSLLQRFTALISTIAAMPFSEEQLRFHVDILLPRNSAALLDHNVGELLTP